MSIMSNLFAVLDDGHNYIEQGWHILAVQPNGKDPYFRFAPKAYLSATNNHADLDEWFNQKPNLNIGIAARQSGLVIIDLDHRDFDNHAWNLEDELTQHHPTYTVRTGDGWHLYYDASNIPDGMRIPGKLGAGIDVKYNGYVVAAPSTHPTGATYTVTNHRTPEPFPTHLIGGRQ